MGFLSKIFKSYSEKEVGRVMPIVQKINSLEPEMEKLTDIELKAKTDEFKARLQKNETLDDILPEAFATVREASKRVLGMRHFDVQLIGGIILHQGRIAEMRTGEGKTLVATLPVYLNALTGKGVHVVTVNDYLAKRDSEWMGKLYKFLGLSVGLVISRMEPSEKKKAYAADITYGTNNEYGFDYLRDNMVINKADMVQRELNYAIVDEIDSILIDEARTPLIISGTAAESSDLYGKADDFVKRLKAKTIVEEDTKDIDQAEDNEKYDYIIDLKAKSATLTEKGTKKAEEYFKLKNLNDIENSDIVHYINKALHAEGIMKKDIDYIVKDGEVLIVDEFSFVGVKLFAQLLENVSPETKILLVCDDEQLPSIPCGNVIKDIMKADIVPTIKLTKIFRYGDNALLTVATDIRNKKPYLNETGCIFEGHKTNKEYSFIEINDNPLSQVMEQYKKMLQKYKQSDIIILSPFNIGDFGTYAINNKIQDTYNPLIGDAEIVKSVQTSHGSTKVHYRKGDRVINTKNIYHAVTPSEFYEGGLKEGETTVVNGDIGIVKKVDLENKCLIINFSENTVVFTFNDLAHLLLGYAISTHKSQGSEFPVVINIVHPQHSKMLTKNLLYVANTRAKELLIEIGDVATINKAIQIEATEDRETFLYELLTN